MINGKNEKNTLSKRQREEKESEREGIKKMN